MPALPLTRQQCLDRLAAGSIGRVGATHQALPVIVPVNYRMVGHSVVFRTEPGGMLERACDGNVVAFEVDGLAPSGQHGWSVLVVGVARALDGSEALRAVESGVVSAAGEGRSRFIALATTQVTGREVPAGPDGYETPGGAVSAVPGPR